MTDLKFNILNYFYSNNTNRDADRIDLLNRGFHDPVIVTYALEELKIQGYIMATSDKIRLTSEGAIAYESEKEVRDKQAEEKRNQRRNQ